MFEKRLYSRLYSYTKPNELSPSKYGFQEGTFTKSAINEILTTNLHNLDQGLVTLFSLFFEIMCITPAVSSKAEHISML